MTELPVLTLEILCTEASIFSSIESTYPEPSLYGITDGKAVGTYLEHKFRAFLKKKYAFTEGNSAIGIDFLELNVDMKVTSINQPQSSCPFRSARQKIFGLGYSLLIFVYEKIDDSISRTSILKILHTIFIDKNKTADFQMTRGLLQILSNEGNKDDLCAYMTEKNLPIDDIEMGKIAEELLTRPLTVGFLTISNALQWRLQYSRVIEKAGQEDGILLVYRL